MNCSYRYHDEVTGLVKRVIFDLGPAWKVEVEGDDGRRHGYDLHELPAPDDDGDPEDFWNGLVGKRVRIRDKREMEVEVLDA